MCVPSSLWSNCWWNCQLCAYSEWNELCRHVEQTPCQWCIPHPHEALLVLSPKGWEGTAKLTHPFHMVMALSSVVYNSCLDEVHLICFVLWRCDLLIFWKHLLFVLCLCVRKGSISDNTHLKLKILIRLEIDYEIHSHSVHKVRKLYMRYIQGWPNHAQLYME